MRRDGWGSAVTVETGGATPGQAHYALGPNGESFMLRHAAGAEVATHHLHDDGFGTTATVTDGAGTVACSAMHDSYGGPQQPAVANPTDAVCNTGQTVNNVWYRGARRDDATGTYQFGSRTYDPAKAGWHTPDSYRAADLQLRVDPLTQNGYAYVNGDPVNKWDPSGHCQQEVLEEQGFDDIKDLHRCLAYYEWAENQGVEGARDLIGTDMGTTLYMMLQPILSLPSFDEVFGMEKRLEIYDRDAPEVDVSAALSLYNLGNITTGKMAK